MSLALTLARRGLGRVWPNPAVGCVIVDKDGHVAGRGWTQDGGRPHAETEALSAASPRARGATAYVSLEPCAHQGQTGPCAQALIDAGIARVVSAVEDPDPRVAGKGNAMLTSAGLSVRTNVLGAQARTVNEGFFSRVVRGRPFVTLKLATTLDGKIALVSGESRWITGERARAHTHLERARHDGVLVGIGTALADDPELTARLPGIRSVQPVRIVVDSNARLPVTSKLAASARTAPVWVLSAASSGPLLQAGVKLLQVPATDKGVDLAAAMTALGAQGLTRILVEGGARLASAMLKAGLVDRLLWYRAPSIMGEGIAAVTLGGLASLKDMPRFRREETIGLGEDVLETYRPAT
jgi:diaminohydroxyphosphoribosylaminopyrimidine deaminase / 5-amino-6-(5-phosphoribosylamino)uracil reductase